MIDFTTLLIFIAVFALVYLYRKAIPPEGLPPGPKGWPFLGHLDMIFYGQERKFHVETARWGKQYGGLYNMQVAQIPTIMVTDLDILKEALLDKADVWSDRPLQVDHFKMITKLQGGVIFQNGEAWKQLRRLTMQSMRDFGVGKKSIEEKIQNEALELFKEIDSKDGNTFEFNQTFNRAVTNVICNVLFGKRNSYEDANYCKLISGMNFIFKTSGFQNLSIFLPWYTYWLIPVFQPAFLKMARHYNEVQAFIREEIQEHKESFDPEEIRDFVDLYLAAEQQEDSTIFTEKNLFGTITDLFFAGSETTSTALLWTVLFLVKDPEIQAKCREEILQNIGNKMPAYEDKAVLPYLEATLSEVLRLGNTLAVLFTHNTSTSATLNGYKIPKHTMLMFNLYAIHTDPKHWDNPKEFRPERFLDESDRYKKPEAFLPFGLGKRACLGEMLARMELFLFATALLQRYELIAEDKSKLPSVDNTSLGVTLIPNSFSVRAVKLS